MRVILAGQDGDDGRSRSPEGTAKRADEQRDLSQVDG